MPEIYAVEGAILARLAERAPLFRTVAPLSTVAGRKPTDITKQCPAAYLTPGPVKSAVALDDGDTAVDTEAWQIVVCIAHLGDPNAAASTCAAASPLIAEVRAALVGWPPAAGYTPLALTFRDAPHFGVAFAEFSLIFETHVAA